MDTDSLYIEIKNKDKISNYDDVGNMLTSKNDYIDGDKK
jgi:hypothetical protein